ncbi:hypothetical protein FQA47_013207 [Oryzias melastigma]|uniref:Uncharacterized protein n=1 Tax=Oryzias melastigma TaxID=30732 RepID=A0A834KWN9_ORYME|nr:hypothetical protein FQA47_013207 [Oryzias melastigma]
MFRCRWSNSHHTSFILRSTAAPPPNVRNYPLRMLTTSVCSVRFAGALPPSVGDRASFRFGSSLRQTGRHAPPTVQHAHRIGAPPPATVT